MVGDIVWWWSRRWRKPPALIAVRQADLAKARKSHRHQREVIESIKATRTALLRREVWGL
jgi:hypothetical protein